MNKYYIITIIPIFIGTLFLFYGLFHIFRIKRLDKIGVKTKGEIIGKKKKKSKFLSGSDEFSSVYYCYEIKYFDINNKVITKESDFGDQTEMNIGDQIEIIYDQNDTSNFLIFIEKQLLFFYIISTIGIIGILLNILILIIKT